MKPFNCQTCAALLAYTDGEKLYFPLQHVNALGRPNLNLIQINLSVVPITCNCGQTRKWFRQETEYQIDQSIPLLLPLT